MKNWTQKGLGICSAALMVAAIASVLGRLPVLQAKDAAFAAAGFIMPAGVTDAMKEDYLEEDEEDNASSDSGQPDMSGADSAPVSSQSTGVSSQASSQAASGTVSSGPSSPVSLPAGVKEMSIANTGSQYNNIWVKNTNKNHTVDVAAELQKQPAVKIVKNSTPQVLIYHTHTTEAFLGDTRSQDKSRSVVAVGDQIAAQLKAAGINVVHDTTLHDYPSYNGSYDRSKVTMQNNLKKYPGIQVTLDIHRDAMGTSDGTRIKPTATINGRKAAQVMIISGCDDDGTLGFPNWEYNFRLAARLQKSMADLYPGLARPLNFCARKYNENLTKGSLLVEFGTEVNTLDEAVYSGELFGKALVKVLNGLS
ncbi:stage II sporulation protein P [Caproiciproducens faecalis]|uniref:Stage II sporulation protein P n=1 Tax=Caproiciproducens faecalis TaxID=2820301 RepID=A0ABS7DQC4_9FIRM|nr:stage II sporulation protein P [Caproiciproducens faecalis]MBW7572776.1 stage II sporulation protein P [Caproiciproducens faecalis]